MEYRISDICSDLSIGKSTIYKRMELLKHNLSQNQWRHNDYFYYTENNKLFFTEKGFNFIKNYKPNCDNIRQDFSINSVSIYENEIIKIYKQRIDYLENENKRLLDLLSIKEQKELSNSVHLLQDKELSSKKHNFWERFFSH